MISWFIDCAIPQRIEPRRNMTSANRKMRLRPYRSPSLPYSGVLTMAVSR